MTAADVLSGTSHWSVEQADAHAWLSALPDDCVDLAITSPPYAQARSYSELNFSLQGEDWVRWMFGIVGELSRVCRGLIAIVCDDQTRDYRWGATPMLLAADLHRAGYCLRHPCCYFRFGVPGSGGADWLRNDHEPILCITRGGKLPWSDNTACGHPPKWGPGGEMSNRLKSGERVGQFGGKQWTGLGRKKNGEKEQLRQSSMRQTVINGTPQPGLFGEVEDLSPVNQWGGHETTGRSTRKDGTKQPPGRPSHKRDGSAKVLANPGNVLKATYPEIPGIPVRDDLALPDFIGIVMLYANATKTDARSLLSTLRQALDSQALPGWFRGVYTTVLGQALLRPDLYGVRREDFADLRLPGLREVVQTTAPWQALLQQCLLCARGPSLSGCEQGASESTQSSDGVRPLRLDETALPTSQGREPVQQRSGQPGSRVPILSQQTPSAEDHVFYMRETAGVARILSEAFAQVQEAWRSAFGEALAMARARKGGRLTYDAETVRQLLEAFATREIDQGDLIRCLVGGGAMGHPLAHSNEAPFAETLSAFFVASFCPPGGVTLDCFMGSGTVGASALKLGRRFIGVDIRASQVELTKRRLSSEAPCLPGIESGNVIRSSVALATASRNGWLSSQSALPGVQT